MEIIREPIEEFGLSKKSKAKTLFAKVAVIGCGTVGQNIVRIISRYGMEAVFIETSKEKIKRGIDNISKELDRLIEHWGLTSGEKKAILSRIKGSTDIREIMGCDMVIEAIRSDFRTSDRKDYVKQIFETIEKNVSENTIIVSTGVTIGITELTSGLKHRGRCVSINLSTNTPDSKIVEVVKGLYTTDEVFDRVKTFAKMINRKFISVEESPGLITDRLFIAMLNEACRLYMEGVSCFSDIDCAMKIGYGLSLGPFEMADKIGIDKVAILMENMYHEFGDIHYKPSPLINKYVRAKRLGRITGHGFYNYSEEKKQC